jgi:transposase InsO family protein
MMSPRPQGDLTVEGMCMLAGVSRAGYYRHWASSMPRQEETAVRDLVQRTALANRRYGYRRIAAQLRREGIVVNRKRVLRLMGEDNLLVLRTRPFVPVTTDCQSASNRDPGSASKRGSDSHLMQFGIRVALPLGEDQRHAASTSPLQSGAGRVCCGKCVL